MLRFMHEAIASKLCLQRSKGQSGNESASPSALELLEDHTDLENLASASVPVTLLPLVVVGNSGCLYSNSHLLMLMSAMAQHSRLENFHR